ncbi:MAG: hypothetical protein U0930_11860 [Pirellulales bacterium]
MALPSIQSVMSRGGKLVLMSHLGRPLKVVLIRSIRWLRRRFD